MAVGKKTRMKKLKKETIGTVATTSYLIRSVVDDDAYGSIRKSLPAVVVVSSSVM
jgi:hypothetical protein